MIQNIVLAVTGSVSAYKAYDLIRDLKREGHKVGVVLTQGATNFIQSQQFHYLGADFVFEAHDDFIPSKMKSIWTQGTVLHIEIARWLDQLIIYPGTAHILAKLSAGLVDDLLSSLYLSLENHQAVHFFPAMNTHMLNHPQTQKNIKNFSNIRSENYIHPTEFGELACKETGEGKLLSKDRALSCRKVSNKKRLPHPQNPSRDIKKVLINAGHTRAQLDHVRFMSNPASGRTSASFIHYLLDFDLEIILLLAHHDNQYFASFPKDLEKLKIHKCSTTDELLQLTHRFIDDVDIFISPAAISDISFDEFDEKISKKSFQQKSFSFHWAPDILSSLRKKEDQIFIGFCASSEDLEKNCADKIKAKNLDYIIGTQVLSSGLHQVGFATAQAHYLIMNKNENILYQGDLEKNQLPQKFFSLIGTTSETIKNQKQNHN